MENDLQLVDLYSWIGLLDLTLFDCGVEEINNEVSKLVEKEHEDRKVLGLVNQSSDLFGIVAFSLATTSLIQKGDHPLERYPVLSIDLLAIQKDHQNKSYGSRLLVSALRAALTINCIAPIKGIYLEALAEASEFYENRGFNELHPFIPGMRLQKLFLNITSVKKMDLDPYSDVFNLD